MNFSFPSGRNGIGFSVRTVLVLVCQFCACQGQAAESDRVLHQTATSIFASAYRQIQQFYLDPVSLEELAVSGIAGLDAADHSFMAGESGHEVTIIEDDHETSRMSAPLPDDADGWAAITSAAIIAARSHSRELEQATDEALFQRVFDGITAKLDRFSRYAGRDQAYNQRVQRDGFGGIGVSLDYSEPTPRISSVVVDSPSARAGIRIDDRLSAIDGIAITRLNQQDVVARLRGAPNSRVSITVTRPQVTLPLVFTLVRSLIVQPTVTSDRQDGIAIFQVQGFNVHTASDLGQEIRQTKADMGAGLKGAVLDLRDNPGGLLDQAAAVSSLFLDRGTVVTTRGRHPTATQYFPATGEDRLQGTPLVVLVNGGTASSAEIVAAALLDNGRAVVAGTSTYGKGTVQMVVQLENGGELTLTWARLITPAGYLLHEHGIIPTFCTASPVNPTAPLEDADTQLHRIIESGTHPPAGTDNGPPSMLDEAAWSRLRAACPPDTRQPPIDLKVAETVLSDPAVYARALSLAPDTVAHAGHVPPSTLH